ncbi:acyl-CoA thioester hydrolase [bacterium A37T11]|nr:acyl-CoA thioester hydrolase [bacterium A37T11]
MFVFETKIRVRYAETDQMGYVYYGNYATYYEVARVEMMRSLQTSYKEMEANGIMMPVLELHCRYLKAAKYDENLLIRVRLEKLPTARITFYYELFNEKQELINTGETTLVFINIQRNRPCQAPTHFIERLKTYF